MLSIRMLEYPLIHKRNRYLKLVFNGIIQVSWRNPNRMNFRAIECCIALYIHTYMHPYTYSNAHIEVHDILCLPNTFMCQQALGCTIVSLQLLFIYFSVLPSLLHSQVFFTQGQGGESSPPSNFMLLHTYYMHSSSSHPSQCKV